MSLTPGTRLGPYEIQSALGAGGMGEVYRARVALDNTLMAVAVSGGGSGFEVGASQMLFKTNPPSNPGYPYDVTADGQRFLFNTDVAPPTPVTVVINWPEALAKR